MLEEAFRGAEKNIKVASSVTCSECKGQGTARRGHRPLPAHRAKALAACAFSRGSSLSNALAQLAKERGALSRMPAAFAWGPVVCVKSALWPVTIPPGVEKMARAFVCPVRAKPVCAAAMRGDLYVILSLASHPLFQREGAHLYCRVPIPMTLAALGGTIQVPTIDGVMADVKVDAGTQTGFQHRLPSKRHVRVAFHNARRFVC